MKCPLCGYHNLPGAAACGQCGRAGGAPAAPARVEEIYPPRARDRTLALEIRERLPRLSRPALALYDRNRSSAWEDGKRWLIVSAAVVPGWGQWLQGRRREAGRLFGLALLLAAGATATIRHPVSQMFPLLALALAWYSVWDAARHGFPAVAADHAAEPLRQARLALLSAVVLFSVLSGAYALLDRRYELLRINTDRYAPIFQRADELMVRRFAPPLTRLRRGDVVIGSPGGADPQAWELVWRGEEGGTPPPAWSGPAIDRVIGLPGDRIDGGGPMLRVNGALLSPEQLPLAFAAAPPFSAVVPPGHVAVWDSGDGVAGSGPLMMMPQAGINGQVVAISQPAERRRWIH